MTIQPVVKQETKKIALGVAVLSLLMIAVFLILRKFDFSVLLGAVIGSLAAIGNFFLMALSVQKAADSMPPLPPEEAEGEDSGEDKEEKEKPLSEEAKNAKKRMQLSYTLRMLMLAAIAIVSVSLPFVNSWAALIPMLFPRIVISLVGLLQKNQKEA